jgi:hypothetical protein
MAMACDRFGMTGKMRLFYKPGAVGNRDLIISAHGGKPESGQKINWPLPGYADTLLWCSQPGLSTTIQVSDILDYRETKKGRCLLYGFRPLPLLKSVTNYELEKFAETASDEDEDYRDYDSWAEQRGCDILSPRNRWFSKEIDLAYVLNHSRIKAKDYKNIYFSFCLS